MNLFASIVGLAEILILCLQMYSVVSQEDMTVHMNGAPQMTNFKLDLHRILEGSRIRKKRQLFESDIVKSVSPSHQMRIGTLSQEYGLSYLSDYKMKLWISFEHHQKHQVLIGTQEGHLILFELSYSDDKEGKVIAVSYEESMASKAMAFSHYDEQWFVILQSSENSTWIRLYQRIGRGLEERQIVFLENEADFDLITIRNEHYLAVLTSTTSSQSILTLYRWGRTHFDKIAARSVYGARSVVCWTLDGILYLAVAQEMNEEDNLQVGSQIYFFNAKDDKGFQLHQIVATDGPRKVLHFYASGSHYVIFFGIGDAVIYWWSYDQFLLWQRIEGTAFATDASILALINGEIMIVIALKEEAFFYTLDASGHYVMTFSVRFSGLLTSLQFMYSGESYYALALFEAGPQSVWKLILNPWPMPKESSLDPLQQCLIDLNEVINKHQNEIDDAQHNLGRVWLKDINQIITTEVIATGNTSSYQPSIIGYVLVVTDHRIHPDSSVPFVENLTSNLKSIVDEIQQNIKNSVFKFIKQEIFGNKHFIQTITIPSLNLESINADVPINGISVSRIHEHGLRRSGSQTFRNQVYVDDIYCESVWTNVLNGFRINDLLLLDGEQEVIGILKFLNIFTNDIQVEKVNSILVDDFVTNGSEQLIEDLKNIYFLNSRVINVQGHTNGEDLGEFSRNIISLFDNSEINGRIVLESVVNVNGDIFLRTLLNGLVDPRQLSLATVTIDSEQDLQGTFSFASNLIVLEDLEVKGLINGVDIKLLMSLSTEQTISGDIKFEDLIIDRDLIVDYVNGIDLDKMAILKTTNPQFVTGLVTFMQLLEAKSIPMTEYVTLDGVDPSLMVQDIVKHKEGVVKSNETSFHNVVVLGNVEATDGVNGLEISNLPKTLWLKHMEQVVDIPIDITQLTTKEDLEVHLVNTIDLDTDVIHTYKNETIISVKTFANDVTIERHVNTSEVVINGFEISSFQNQKDKYMKEGTILGEKTLQTLEIHGNIAAGTLNGLQMKDIMRPEAFQKVSGEIELISELTSVPADLASNAIELETVNNINFQDYINSAVTVEPRYIITNKEFRDLKAQELILNEGSMLNGLDFYDMMNKIVTLNTLQDIHGLKTFLKPIHLEESSVVSTLNGKTWENIINNVVYTDEASHVRSSKTFNRAVQGTSLSVQGLINGINIDHMAKNAFLKSENNEVYAPLTFLADLKIDNLVVKSLIDNMSWYDLIYTQLDEELGSVQFLTDVNLLANVQIDGLLNGCTFTQIEERAMHANKTNQFIKEKIIVRDIQIIGDLHMKNIINQILIEELPQKFIPLAQDQVINTDVRLDPGFKAINLNLADFSSQVISRILYDAVRFSIPQEISGYKHFQELNVNALNAENAFIVESLNDIDLTDLYDNAVLKAEEQTIVGEKIFHSLKANNAIIEGYINGLRLPYDIVRTDTDEHISSPTLVESDLTLGSNINIHGTIDEVDVAILFLNRVTLTEDQFVSSHLSFLRDVYVHDDFYISGTVNNLVLELVSKINQYIPLDGQKTFAEDLIVEESLVASPINGYDIKQMDENILRHNKAEYINDLQEFENSLAARNSLSADWIEGKSLSSITSAFLEKAANYGETSDYLQNLGSGLNEYVTNQLKASKNLFTRFAYFILIQDIDLGPIIKILNGRHIEYANGEISHSIVIWTSPKKCSYKECCQTEFSYWMSIKNSGYLINGPSKSGRIYPLPNPSDITKDFVIWTNTTNDQYKWCTLSEVLLLASLEEHNEMEELMRIEDAPILSDVKSFKRGHVYAVAGFYFDKKQNEYSGTEVYVFNETELNWRKHQTLPSFGVLSLDITRTLEGEILLAVGTGMGTYSSIYTWNDDQSTFDRLQNISPKSVTSTVWFKEGSVQLLAMSSVAHWPKNGEDCEEILKGGQIDIFAYNGQAKRIQSLPLQGVVSMIALDLTGDTFLVAASHQLQSIFIYEWKGYERLRLIQSIFVGEVRHLNTFTIGDNVYVTVAITSGPSKLLKVVLQGRKAGESMKMNFLGLRNESDE